MVIVIAPAAKGTRTFSSSCKDLDTLTLHVELETGITTDKFSLMIPGRPGTPRDLANCGSNLVLRQELHTDAQFLLHQISAEVNAQITEATAFSALFWASRHGDVALVETLLEKFPGVHRQRSPSGRSALHAAAAGDHVTVLVTLAGHIDEPRQECAQGLTPYQTAVQAGASCAAKWLRKHMRTTLRNSALKKFQDHSESRILSNGRTKTTSTLNTNATSLSVNRARTASSSRSLPAPRSRCERCEGRQTRSATVRTEKYDAASARSAGSTPLYYRTQYHGRAVEDGVYPPRPATADCRYRHWKTWLLRQYAEREQRRRAATAPAAVQRAERNLQAVQAWTRRKLQEESDTDSSSEEEEVRGRTVTFSDWCERKAGATPVLSHPDYERRQREKALQKQHLVGVVHFRSTAPETPPPDPRLNLRSYQRWKRRTHHGRLYARAQGMYIPSADDVTEQQVERERQALLGSSMTYGEWLGLKQRQRQAASNKTPTA